MGVVHFATTMKITLFLLSALVAVTLSAPSTEPKGLACDICQTVITDLADFITSETTQEEILSFAHELCHVLGTVLGAAIEADCNAMFDTSLPDIIDGIVSGTDALTVCTNIFLCP